MVREKKKRKSEPKPSLKDAHPLSLPGHSTREEGRKNKKRKKEEEGGLNCGQAGKSVCWSATEDIQSPTMYLGLN